MDHRGFVDIDEVLMLIFEPKAYEDGWEINATEAFAFFACDYARKTGENPDAICFNSVGILEALKRFTRDVWGVKRFCNRMEHELGSFDNTGKLLNIVKNEMRTLGLRISSDNPRKTRIAAAFALWMATFRPLHIIPKDSQVEKAEWALFPFAFIFSLTIMYLTRFGTVKCGVDDYDEKVRISHIIHDLHCRVLCLSPLELLYSGIFRPA